MTKPNHIVVTTINVPVLLREYQENLMKHDHLKDTIVWLVADKKTPVETQLLCQEVTAKGLEVRFLGVQEQDAWGERFPELYSRIPFNNETRRNIGYLHALEHGCERLISIDDDNWPTGDDFVGGHLNTGKIWSNAILSEPNGFHNVCEYLEFNPRRDIFPRGYPFDRRGAANKPRSINPSANATVGVTAGLWLREPDIDATSWLNGKISGVGYLGPDHFVLAQDTWSPINTQNTSVVRELIPAYLCIPMGWKVPGGKIERYGDIWGGYFLQALINGTEYHVSFGRPLVDHRRNPHDYVDDLRHEFWGMVLTDWLLDLLRREFKPEGNDMCDRVDQLSTFLLDVGLANLPSWCAEEMKEFLRYTAYNLSEWSAACRQLR